MSIIPLPIVKRPRTRGECANVPRPCPFVSCRYHILHCETSRERTSLPAREAAREHDGVTDSCALDVADRGSHTWSEVAQVMGVTKQAVDQIEARALRKLALGKGRGLR